MKKDLLAGFGLLAMLLIGCVIYFMYPHYLLQEEWNQTVIVKNSVANPEKITYTIEVKETTECIFYVDFKDTRQKGVFTGFRLSRQLENDMNRYYMTNIGEYMKGTSNPLVVHPGTYVLEVAFLTTQRQLREWYMTTKDIEYDFAEEGTFHMNYEFGFKENRSIDGIPAFLIQLVSVILMLSLYFALCQKGNAIRKVHDERQIQLFGRAYRYAFVVVGILSMLYFLCDAVGLALPFAEGVGEFFIFLIGLSVVLLYCTWKDVLFAMNHRESAILVLFTIFAAFHMLLTIHNIHGHRFITEGKLTEHSVSLFYCILYFLLVGIRIVRNICREREEE